MGAAIGLALVFAGAFAASAHGAYQNPVYAAGDFADPMVLRDGGTYWAYGSGPGFPMLRSTDLVTWQDAGYALGSRPTWATTGPEWHPWAPSVIRRETPCAGTVSAPCYLMFFSASSADFGVETNCIGMATSSTPSGPFEDRGILRDQQGINIGCGDANGHGNIDPHPFVDDDGKAYLYVSTDFTCDPGCSLRPTMSVIPLTADLAQAGGPRQPLFSGAANTWEQAPWAPVVENPWVVKRGSTYHLLFSGGDWNSGYGMGHATAPTPTGPFTRSSDNPATPEVEVAPILAQTGSLLGPGGGSLVTGPLGGEWLVYHARSPESPDVRNLYVDPFVWQNERPVVQGSSFAPLFVTP